MDTASMVVGRSMDLAAAAGAADDDDEKACDKYWIRATKEDFALLKCNF